MFLLVSCLVDAAGSNCASYGKLLNNTGSGRPCYDCHGNEERNVTAQGVALTIVLSQYGCP